MFERMDVDNPDVWEPISLAELEFRLAGYYKNANILKLVQYLLDNPDDFGRIRTPFAFYRYRNPANSDDTILLDRLISEVEFANEISITQEEFSHMVMQITSQVERIRAGKESMPEHWRE